MNLHGSTMEAAAGVGQPRTGEGSCGGTWGGILAATALASANGGGSGGGGGGGGGGPHRRGGASG